MGTIRIRSKALSDNPELKAPVFNFSEYVADGEHTYYNNENQIDFVTANNSLYVCLSHDGVTPAYDDIDDNADFLKLVSQGPQGIRGPRGHDGDSAETPRLNAEFDNDQLRVYINGELETVSPRLTGKSWRPKLEDNMIVWELSNKMYAPDPIDLEELRPIQENPLLLRVDSDNTKRTDEKSGPARFIQWKYEGDQHWTNLISISELMNLALVGITIFPVENTETGKTEYHLGHKEVLEATYDSDKDGHRIISNVELGHVLFDAGPIPIGEGSGDDNDFQGQIDLIFADLARLDTSVVKSVTINGDKKTPNSSGNVSFDIPIGAGDLSGYATENWVQNNYQPKGNYLTEHQHLKTINNQSLIGDGNITISAGGVSLLDITIENNRLKKTFNGQEWIDVGEVNGGSSTDLTQLKLRVGDPNDSSKRNHLFISYDNGTTWTDAGEFLDTDTQYELQGYATIQMLQDLYYQKSVLYTKTEIDNMLSGADVDLTSYRTFTIYQRSASNNENDIHLPNDNIVAVWNVSEGVLDLPSGYTDWTNHPENATSQKPYLWMASATFESKQGSRVSPWDGPFCLTGKDGKDGEDGDGIEFIYHLGPMGVNSAKPTAPSIDYTKSKNYNDNTTATRVKSWWATEASNDACPGDGNNGYWTDNPQGIDDLENSKVEWAAIRKSHYDSTNKVTVWEDFCQPFIWSMWGEDGMDGDGVEYIFAVAAESETAIDPQTGKRELNASFFRGQTATQILPLTDQEVTTLGASYQISDWCPDGTTRQGYLMPDLNWTDNPSDVGPDQPYEFVAIRKKKLDSVSGQMKWGPFSTPALWGFWGQKTVTVIESGTVYRHPYTCFAFTRSATDITGYTVVNPWTQTNPAQTYAEWIAVDNTRETGYYENPLNYIVTLDENNQVVSSSTLSWSDTIPAPPGQLYMITNHIGDEASGSDQGWTSPRAWGDAAGFQVEYAVADENTTDNVYNRIQGYTLPKLDNYDLDNYPNLNDPDNDGIDEAAWRTAVQNSGKGVWGDENDIPDPDYMATCYKKQEGVWSNWQISRIKGEKGEDSTVPGPAGRDGSDIEFIYYRTKTNTIPTISTNAYKVGNTEYNNADYDSIDDALPKVNNYSTAGGSNWSDGGQYWHDHPEGVTSTYAYEWTSCRRSYYNNGVKTWEPFYTPATLWSKYGENGHDGDGIEYVFWDLTEEQAASINGDILPTRLSDTNYTDNHNPAKHINESECLPSITLTVNGSNVSLIAKDENPGVSDQKPYVYASMRKYNGTLGEWKEFSPIRLWLIRPDDVSSNGILDIKNSVFSVELDENGRTKKLTYDPSSNVELRNSRVLMNLDAIEIEGSNGDIIRATYNYDNETATYNKNQTVVITDEDGISATVNIYSAGCKEDRRCSIALHVVFSQVNGQNPQLSKPFIIPITGINSTLGIVIEGTDFFRLSPTTESKKISLDTTYGLTKIWTTSKGSGDYKTNSTTWPITANGIGSSLLGNTDIRYFFKFDDQVNYMSFALPLATLNANGRYQITHNGTTIIDGNGRQSFTFYFDKNGNAVNNSQDAFFWIHLGNPDIGDNADPWTVWASYAGVYFSKFYTSHVDGQDDYPIDEIVIGVGTNASVTPIDYEPIPILYDGKNGRRGTSVEIIGIVESSSDSVVVNPTSDQNSSNNEVEDGESEEENSGGSRKAPTRGEQTEAPEIEIDENGQITVVDNEDGTITISDDSGDYSVLNIANGSVNKFQILKITQYDENDNASVTYEAKKIQTVESIPSWYLIKDAFYYSAGSDDPIAHQIRKNIYALIVDNGQIHVLTVSSESDESEELEPEG